MYDPHVKGLIGCFLCIYSEELVDKGQWPPLLSPNLFYPSTWHQYPPDNPCWINRSLATPVWHFFTENRLMSGHGVRFTVNGCVYHLLPVHMLLFFSLFFVTPTDPLLHGVWFCNHHVAVNNIHIYFWANDNSPWVKWIRPCLYGMFYTQALI